MCCSGSEMAQVLTAAATPLATRLSTRGRRQPQSARASARRGGEGQGGGGEAVELRAGLVLLACVELKMRVGHAWGVPKCVQLDGCGAGGGGGGGARGEAGGKPSSSRSVQQTTHRATAPPTAQSRAAWPAVRPPPRPWGPWRRTGPGCRWRGPMRRPVARSCRRCPRHAPHPAAGAGPPRWLRRPGQPASEADGNQD